MVKLKLTKQQFNSLVNAIDDISSMIGGGDSDEEWQKIVDNLDKMLKSNNLKRVHK